MTLPAKRVCLEALPDDVVKPAEEPNSGDSDSDSTSPEGLEESDVGIAAFINPNIHGFKCTLKNRYKQFSLIPFKLTSFVQTKPEAQSAVAILEPYHADLTKLMNHECEQVKIEAPELKEERTAIHKAIRAVYPQLDSRTVRVDESHQIITVNRAASGCPSFRVPKNQAYCRFVLYKEGKDTISAIQLLSRCLHIRPGSFAYAGTKDRRAITTQFVTLKGIDSHRLSALNRKLRGIRLGNFSYVPRPLFLGDLDGNRFTLVLRSVQALDSVVQKAIEVWQRDGFINYYGLQRFGHSAKAKSFDTGRYIIQNDWTSAINAILLPTKADLPCVRQLKHNYLKGDSAKQCADSGPPCMERELLCGVDKHGLTVKALQSLPRNLRQLYVHSYQSRIWNRVATRRIRDLSTDTDSLPHTIAGDLYLPSAADLGCDLLDDFSVVPEDEDSERQDQARRSDDRPSLPCPKVATATDCSSIPITDVVLPLPGFAVRYPENESGQWYHELLKEDGLTVDSLRHQVKDFALPGSYRALVVKPKDVSFTIREYTDPSVPLIESDLQKLEGSANQSNETNAHEHNASSEPVDNSNTSKSERAVVLQFTLPKSSYATVAIRELTKCFVEKH
ncbi:unnamed protein product [Echinostoma caproni]|uniref:TRUD domain-containing protein n=1 Tax=Echinostoma caproni TaxID=27848 RepID=A0A183AA80_9TREM|nr:unnamed protein product [Echinostoma caproni]